MAILTSEIDRITLFHRGALVHRRASVPTGTDGWPEEIELRGLPLSLDDTRVRLVVRTGDAEVGAVHVGLGVAPRAASPLPPDHQELRRLEREILRRERRIAVLTQELGGLGSVDVADARPPSFEDRPPPASPMAGRVALEALLDDAERTRRAALRALHAELVPLREALAALRDRITREEAGKAARPDEVTRVVRASLRVAPGSGPVELGLSYFVGGARWAPTYQVWIDGEIARISLRALVTQATGEDWRGARLSLSTAAPLRWHELPELASIRIGRAQPAAAPKTGYREPPRGAERLLADWDRDRARLPAAPGQAPLPAIPSVRPLTELALLGGSGDDEGYAEALMECADEPCPEPMMDTMSAFGGGGRGGPGAPPPPPAPAPAMRRSAAVESPKLKKSAEMKSSSRRDEADFEREESAPEAPGRPTFEALTLPDLSHPQRGRLVPLDRRAAWLAPLAAAGRVIPFDAAALVDRAWAAAASAANAALPADAVDVREAAGRFDYVYDTDLGVDVPSDGGWHAIPVGDRTAACRLHYVVVPREDLSAWRVASLENPLRSPLLPGPVEVYVDGEFVLATRLPAVAPRERFQLGLGVEQAIRVARNTTFTERRSGSAVVATTELCHELSVTIRSHLKRPVPCQVRERIPQPAKGAEVVVEEVDVQPGWHPYYQDELGSVILGGRRWEIELPPGREVALTASYVVKLYVNNQVVGGNRREA